MRRWTLTVLLASLAITAAMPAAAQWKWRDAKGQTQYSDMPPPPGVADRDILSRPNAPQRRASIVGAATAASAASGAMAAASAAPLLAPKASEPELEAKRRAVEQQEAAKKKAEEARLAAIRADNCNRAKDQMRTFDSGLRMARINAKGEREILDDATRAAEAQRAKGVIASDCK
jgi:Domain of unknown function (DUF4124)